MLNDKIMPYLKAYAALIGSVLTAIIGSVTPDDPLYKVLTIALAICTAITVWAVPNATTLKQAIDNTHGHEEDDTDDYDVPGDGLLEVPGEEPVWGEEGS